MGQEETLAEKIYHVMQAYLPAEGPQRLKKVVVRCGELDAIDLGQLNHCWTTAATGSAYRDSRLEIVREGAVGRCLTCNQTFEIGDHTSACPRCGCEQFTIMHPVPTIETYELE